MRALYKSRHDTLLAALKNWNPDLRISGENAGVHLLLHFHDNRSEERLICLAQAGESKFMDCRSIMVKGEKTEQESVILLGYANMNEEKIKKAVDLLKDAWSM